MTNDRLSTPLGYTIPNPDTIPRNQIHEEIQGSLRRLAVLENNKDLPYTLMDLKVITAEAKLLKRLTKKMYNEGVNSSVEREEKLQNASFVRGGTPPPSQNPPLK